MFTGIAAVELQEHFAELAELAGTDADNIRTAILDENREVEVTYPGTPSRPAPEQAGAADEVAVAERFEEMEEDEREHEKTLERLELSA